MRSVFTIPFTVAVFLFPTVFLHAAEAPVESAFKAALLSTTTRHLNALLDSEGKSIFGAIDQQVAERSAG